MLLHNGISLIGHNGAQDRLCALAKAAATSLARGAIFVELQVGDAAQVPEGSIAEGAQRKIIPCKIQHDGGKP